jgi:hypothetical protein
MQTCSKCNPDKSFTITRLHKNNSGELVDYGYPWWSRGITTLALAVSLGACAVDPMNYVPMESTDAGKQSAPQESSGSRQNASNQMARNRLQSCGMLASLESSYARQLAAAPASPLSQSTQARLDAVRQVRLERNCANTPTTAGQSPALKSEQQK